jgi:hypothetical protein
MGVERIILKIAVGVTESKPCGVGGCCGLGSIGSILIWGIVIESGDYVLVDYRQLLKFLLWKIISELGIENAKS